MHPLSFIQYVLHHTESRQERGSRPCVGKLSDKTHIIRESGSSPKFPFYLTSGHPGSDHLKYAKCKGLRGPFRLTNHDAQIIHSHICTHFYHSLKQVNSEEIWGLVGGIVYQYSNQGMCTESKIVLFL